MDYRDVGARLQGVRERIAGACSRSGRQVSEVTIVAVTKTHPAGAVEALRQVGLRDVGENRVQELEEKVGAVGRAAVRWHLIGRLQRNKVRKAIGLADLIHSVDSLRLAEKISQEAAGEGRSVEVLVQVNVSGEETKGGLEGPGMLEELACICALPALSVRGLMTMAPFTADERIVRRVFAAAREVSERAAETITSYRPDQLSMGMSGDFEIAIEEGSTMVRLGTVLLGERDR